MSNFVTSMAFFAFGVVVLEFKPALGLDLRRRTRHRRPSTRSQVKSTTAMLAAAADGVRRATVPEPCTGVDDEDDKSNAAVVVIAVDAC